jgi:photosynthetic reaction center H subunit
VPDSDDGHGGPKLAPMRIAHDFYISEEDPDPRGMPAVGADEKVGGVVVDCWVDRTEVLIRYLEIETPAPLGGVGAPRRVLVPMPLVRMDVAGKRVVVKSVMGAQFADAPVLANPDQITMREEDQVSAYFGGGNLYADVRRMGPIL